ncbi:MAG: hypothetical protein CL521_01715 [Actinobacteria bacterium]|nr:hypothetical protein [Actinomycetota bacterium]
MLICSTELFPQSNRSLMSQLLHNIQTFEYLPRAAMSIDPYRSEIQFNAHIGNDWRVIIGDVSYFYDPDTGAALLEGDDIYTTYNSDWDSKPITVVSGLKRATILGAGLEKPWALTKNLNGTFKFYFSRIVLTDHDAYTQYWASHAYLRRQTELVLFFLGNELGVQQDSVHFKTPQTTRALWLRMNLAQLTNLPLSIKALWRDDVINSRHYTALYRLLGIEIQSLKIELGGDFDQNWLIQLNYHPQ